MASPVLDRWNPQCQADKDAVMAQLEKLVSHPALKSSRRCPALLRYVVEHQLQNETAKLKERMIGIELFGRDSDYDSNSDPVVRTTANDLRKRIAQYYHQPGHEWELRISFPAGSYFAQFHLPEVPTSEPAAGVSFKLSAPLIMPLPQRPYAGRAWRRYVISACLILATAIAIVWRQPRGMPRTLESFWRPLTQSSHVLVCIGTWSISPPNQGASQQSTNDLGVHDLLPMTDAIAFSRVTAFLGETRTPFSVQSAKNTTLADLTKEPVVVIGAVDNPWTLRITDPLRFHFIARDNTLPKWVIADRKDSARLYVGSGVPDAGSAKDYAIIGRLSNGTSGQVSVVVAGLGAAGTTVASAFVTNALYTDALAKRDSGYLKAKNLELVVSVDIVDGKPGAPHIEAVEVW